MLFASGLGPSFLPRRSGTIVRRYLESTIARFALVKTVCTVNTVHKRTAHPLFEPIINQKSTVCTFLFIVRCLYYFPLKMKPIEGGRKTDILS